MELGLRGLNFIRPDPRQIRTGFLGMLCRIRLNPGCALLAANPMRSSPALRRPASLIVSVGSRIFLCEAASEAPVRIHNFD